MKMTLGYIYGYVLYYGLLKESPASKWLNLRALVAAMFKEKHENPFDQVFHGTRPNIST